ncbi:type 1 glutamine amidotransferase [Ammoniphilus sp. CFH 90114]|uniref:type 1 glutamine amidotransferase n=1 Tax=Ammoniphilus sp. CFH 90114 TaxID=2493665 RepID=UPI00100FC7C4|nr:type 1 glutamine amidotransferase [Ammoniphilus sp. CFH 90114]RXT06538.1 type 1 glutamine amidotransferase [Ammoniphilus sp. CFH 90114]
MNIHYIQNDPLATPGFIKDWVKERGYTLTGTQFYNRDPLPILEHVDLLIILGGRMGAYEEEKYPWLREEKEFIRQAVQQKKGVLGICLGAQMIADALGGRAYPHVHSEIGWWPLEFTEEVRNNPFPQEFCSSLNMFQFHSDTFDLPDGAVQLATSTACKNQAFVYGERVVGLQFHPEFTLEMIRSLAQLFRDALPNGPFIQSPEQWEERGSELEQARSFLFGLLDRMVKKQER